MTRSYQNEIPDRQLKSSRSIPRLGGCRSEIHLLMRSGKLWHFTTYLQKEKKWRGGERGAWEAAFSWRVTFRISCPCTYVFLCSTTLVHYNECRFSPAQTTKLKRGGKCSTKETCDSSRKTHSTHERWIAKERRKSQWEGGEHRREGYLA